MPDAAAFVDDPLRVASLLLLAAAAVSWGWLVTEWILAVRRRIPIPEFSPPDTPVG